MNEDQVTTLLDTLGRDIEVSPAPIEDVTHAGGRRLRLRHLAEVGAAAFVVLALASGGFVLQQQLAADSLATKRLPTVAPSVGELLGSWRPVMLLGNPTPPQGLSAKPIRFGRGPEEGMLTWRGSDGCNQVVGSARLGPDGAFDASVRYTTAMGCLGVKGSLPFSGVSAVKAASQLQLTAGRLSLTSESGARLGAFVPYQATERPWLGPPPLPGTVPTGAELFAAGKWFGPIGRVAAKLGTETEKTAVAFSHRHVTSEKANVTLLNWAGYDGCNWVTGLARLTGDGHFSTSQVGSTLRGCIRSNGRPIHPAVSSIEVIEAAAHVRLVNGKLRFYDDAGQLLGILRPWVV